MFNRREFLKRSSLLAAAPFVPGFVANTAMAAEPGKDTVLVILEMTGGNDGLNTVVPVNDDDYHKNRPTIRVQKSNSVAFTDDLVLHPSLRSMAQLIQKSQVSVVQGVGYPNPDRSHFESMDRWQAGEPGPKVGGIGWLSRSVPDLQRGADGGVPIMHIGSEKLPLACRGTTQGIFTINQEQPFELKLGRPGSAQEKSRKALLADLSQGSLVDDQESLLSFVQKRHLQTYSSLEKLKEVLKENQLPNQQLAYGTPGTNLYLKMDLVTKLIQKGFGTRVFYLAIDGFDTHSQQDRAHSALLQQIGDSCLNMFTRLQQSGDDKRVLFMTYSEFGRRVKENGSAGTDHGAASSMFVVGPGVKGGAVGKHPSLTDLDDGDLKHHTDFRRVYATLLDEWLDVDSKTVLREKFEHVDLLRKRT
ncbi:MAG: DUF1501 domain-containing protein [Planctomycetes bacterium]|nr:DUF1501 domain-containing protein [Planctomycetota bacterium]